MAMDLETPNPEPTPAPAATPPPAEPPVAAAPEPSTTPDELEPSDLVDAEKAKGLIGALKATREELKAAKEAAAKVKDYEAYFTAKAPYITVLEQNPELFKQAAQPKAPAAPPPPESNPELVEIARLMDYYKADGSPDLDRAARYNTLLETKAARQAQQMVAPIAQSTNEQRANANFTHFAAQKTPTGQPIDQNILAKYFRALPAQYTADSRVASVAFNLAAMEQMSNSPLPPPPAAPTAPPLVTENVGAGPRRTAPLSQVERDVLAQRGLTEQKYSQLTKGFTAGRTSSLEDE